MEKKLQVKDLTISFRTSNGKVQAVRGINFDLNKGETLAIVGESGSGKSVTSKAILGILAGNSIVEGGEIIYDGKDLLKISEEDFHKIRGDKIAMIFQDPMSSLNPIIKIGRQLTEAMILKGKARQRESRMVFNTMLKDLQSAMIAAIAGADKGKAAAIEAKCANFNKFEYKHIELESAYNVAHEAASEGSYELESLIFEIEKDAAKDLVYRVKKVEALATASVHEYVVKDRAERLLELAKTATAAAKSMKQAIKNKTQADVSATLVKSLTEVKEIFDEAVAFVAPNFFAMGYYLTFCTDPLPTLSVEELNVFLRKYLDDNFMLDFIADARRGVEYSANEYYREKEEALAVLEASKAVFEKADLDRKECYAMLKSLAKEVGETIDKLEIIKDSLAYTFASGLKSEIDRYFHSIVKNKKEQERFAKQQAQYDRMVAKGKEPDADLDTKIILKVGDNITTDHIMPAGTKILPYRSNVPKLSEFCFTVCDPSFPERAKAEGGGVILGGTNYGQGSSREHAALVPLYLGIKAVIAKSFARIHVANLINFGIVPMTLKNPDDYEKIAEGEGISIEGFAEAIASKCEVTLRSASGESIELELNFTERQRAILLSGGLLNYTKKNSN